ncbi:MAG: putative baseplate assembly protein [Candidatus Manganitrophaceae bacterium]|nr:MAG: putative baseplate assembly protein [Candidatus Manganitrophaceae bacterium]
MSGPQPPKITTLNRRPVIDYVTKDYEGFRQGMLNQIPLLLPNWTDRSESDFGVALIELYAYVADILSYYQDRIANEAYLPTATQRRSVVELLRLIDYRIDPGLAASVWIHFDASADVTVGGTSLPYRLKTAGVPGEPDQNFEITQEFSLKQLNSGIDLTLSAVGLTALGAETQSIELKRADHALDAGGRVYFEEKRPQPDGSFKIRRSPMLQIIQIEPAGVNVDRITWLPPLPEPLDPAKTTLKGNNVVATHGESVFDEPLFIGDGTPGQRMTLSRKPVTHLIKMGPFTRRRSRPELEVRVDGVLWDEVENFFQSKPSDLHYVTFIDESDSLTITFGTGQRGSVVPAGAQVKAVYRIGLGSQGNVGADTLTVALSAIPQITKITNPFNAEGGADRETTEEAKISGPGSIIAQERAVTLQDYDLLARAFPGVGKAKARVGLRGGYKVVQVYIAPENPTVIPPPFASGALKEALKAHLEARQPVNRMAGVDVLDPIYVPVDISVDVYLKADAGQEAVRKNVLNVLHDLLSFARLEFGQPIRVGEVFSALYPVEGVAYVLLKRLARSGLPPATHHEECDFADVPIGENELAYEGLLTINLFGGIR